MVGSTIPRGLEADQNRDYALSELGLRALRFSNHQILTETDAVMEQVYYIAKHRLEFHSCET